MCVEYYLSWCDVLENMWRVLFLRNLNSGQYLKDGLLNDTYNIPIVGFRVFVSL